MQGIMALMIGAAYVFFPLPGVHTTIHPRVYFANRILLNKHRVTAKFKLKKRITQQFFLHGYTVLLPFALQVILAFALQAGVEGAGG